MPWRPSFAWGVFRNLLIRCCRRVRFKFWRKFPFIKKFWRSISLNRLISSSDNLFCCHIFLRHRWEDIASDHFFTHVNEHWIGIRKFQKIFPPSKKMAIFLPAAIYYNGKFCHKIVWTLLPSTLTNFNVKF